MGLSSAELTCHLFNPFVPPPPCPHRILVLLGLGAVERDQKERDEGLFDLAGFLGSPFFSKLLVVGNIHGPL